MKNYLWKFLLILEALLEIFGTRVTLSLYLQILLNHVVFLYYHRSNNKILEYIISSFYIIILPCMIFRLTVNGFDLFLNGVISIDPSEISSSSLNDYLILEDDLNVEKQEELKVQKEVKNKSFIDQNHRVVNYIWIVTAVVIYIAVSSSSSI